MSLSVPLVRVKVAVAVVVVSAAALALIVTAAFVGRVAGAVKVVGAPLAVVAGLTVPHVGAQLAPFCVSVQLTPAFVGSFLTVVVNCWVALIGMIPLTGETVCTTMAGTVTVAAADFVVSVTDVAVRVTVRSSGDSPGAV